MIPIRNFVTAGKALFTITSEKTGQHFTYKATRKPGTPVFISVLRGSNNEGDYSFIGTIKSDGRFYHGHRSKIGVEAPSVRAFEWFWRNLKNSPPQHCRFEHAGKCCVCGRTLTHPDSIALGVGPECSQKSTF